MHRATQTTPHKTQQHTTPSDQFAHAMYYTIALNPTFSVTQHFQSEKLGVTLKRLTI
jgi:hypothetical protein